MPNTSAPTAAATVQEAMSIEINSAYLSYKDNGDPVLKDLDIAIPAKQWACILGRSGCGKTSLLRYLADLSARYVLDAGMEIAFWQQGLDVS